MKALPPRICVPVCVGRADEIPPAMQRAAETADVIELRLDCLDESERDIARDLLPDWLSQSGVPVILTLRASAEGGRAAIDAEAREQFWTSIGELTDACLIDLELDLTERFANESSLKLPVDWRAVICSYHDFAGTPADLDQIYERMAATPAGILKIAVQANDATDCIEIFGLLERAQRDKFESRTFSTDDGPLPR